MAMGTDRSKALHNFTMPCGLRWGNQRFLRCMKVNSDGQISHLHRFNINSSDNNNNLLIQQRRTARDRDRERERGSSLELWRGSDRVGPTPTNGARRLSDEDDGIAATHQKVMLDLQTAADKMKDAFKDGLDNREVSISPSVLPLPPLPPQPVSLDSDCPWKLRTRRAAACKTPENGLTASSGSDGADVKSPRPISGLPLPLTTVVSTFLKSPIHLSNGNAAANGEKERVKFSIPLPKRDIEEDFYTMVGHRPPRRPKKRSRIVQKQLDTLFPALWLTEVTPDMYQVVESAP